MGTRHSPSRGLEFVREVNGRPREQKFVEPAGVRHLRIDDARPVDATTDKKPVRTFDEDALYQATRHEIHGLS